MRHKNTKASSAKHYPMHYIDEIRRDPESIPQKGWEHIQNCSLCHREWSFASKLEQAIEKIPQEEVPHLLKQNIWQSLREPALRPLFAFWVFMGPILALFLAPLIMRYYINLAWLSLSSSWEIFFTLFSTFWGMVLVTAMAVQILYQHKSLVERLEQSVEQILPGHKHDKSP